MRKELSNNKIILEDFLGIGFLNSQQGWIKAVTKNDKLVSLDFIGTPNLKEENITTTITEILKQLTKYFAGEMKEFSIDLELTGTDFQIKVWKELLKIPYGETISYQELATRIGNINSARAVGMANNKNKISIIIPCHRVIGKDGSLTGYEGGIHIKEGLLNLERKNKDI